MSVLNDVLNQAGNYTGESTRGYSGVVSKEYLMSIVNDVNANYKPKSGWVCLNFIYQSKYPVGIDLVNKCIDFVKENTKTFLFSSFGASGSLFPDDCRKFRVCVVSKNMDIEEFLENMKPYLILDSSMDLIDIDITYRL